MTYGNYPDLSQILRVLVIKMRHHGDVLLTSPVFSNLKRVMPHAQIDAFIYKDTLPMLEGHPAITEFLEYDRSWKKLPLFQRIYKEISLLKKIRQAKYDLVINLTEGDRGALAALVSGSRYRVGFDPQKKGFFGKGKIYTHLVKQCATPRHTVERQLDVLRRIGIFPAPEERDLLLQIPDCAFSKIRKMLEAEEIKTGSYVTIHPVSRWRFKCLPPAQIAALIRRLDSLGHRVVLTAGPDPQEKAMIEEIIRLVPEIAVCNLAGKMLLKELGAVIKMSRMLICVDSVPLHMASALKVPVVAIFGPTSDQNWGPWMHPESCVVAKKISCRPCHLDGCGGSKMSDCLHHLSISEILEAVIKLSKEEVVCLL